MASSDPIQEGQEAMLGGDYFAAQDIFLGLLRDDPHDDNALYHLGLCHIASEGWEEAEDVLRRCLEINPRHTDALIELGEVQFARNLPEAAMLSFSQATAQDPQNARAWVAVARIHEMLGMDLEAVENYEKAMMLSDPVEAPGYDLALAYARIGRYLRADIILDGLISETLRQGTQNFATDLSPGTRDDLMDYLSEMKEDRDEIRNAYEEEHGFPMDTARWLYRAQVVFQELEASLQTSILAEIRLLRLMGIDESASAAVYRLQSMEGHFSGPQLLCMEFVLAQLLGETEPRPNELISAAWSEVKAIFT